MRVKVQRWFNLILNQKKKIQGEITGIQAANNGERDREIQQTSDAMVRVCQRVVTSTTKFVESNLCAKRY